MAESSLEKETRRAFHKIHLEHLADPHVADRHSDIVDPSSMGLPVDFLVGARCADLGCGSAGHGVVNLLSLGAKFVNALDLDQSFIKPLNDRIQQIGDHSDCWQADVGSILELPYEANSFDFVLCRGVIHHVSDELTALKEINRVLKDGAKAFIFVTGKGGILNRFFKETLRDEYQSNPEMRAVVESGDIEQWLKTQITDLKAKIDPDDESSWRASVNLLENLCELINNDLALSLKDMLEAPEYKSYSESEWFSLLEEAGFKQYYRVFKKPRYRNVRKIFAPLFVEHDHPLARLLYGDGSMNVIVTK
jgi:ubiquinone/menaquinone biosynthesis C-methylase UbiE